MPVHTIWITLVLEILSDQLDSVRSAVGGVVEELEHPDIGARYFYR